MYITVVYFQEIPVDFAISIVFSHWHDRVQFEFEIRLVYTPPQ